MFKLALFNFQTYSRKYKFVPPTGCYLIFLLINYSTVPNPVLSSFGSTMMLNFLVMSWFTLSFIQSQNSTQQIISSMHIRSKKLFFMSNYLSMLLLCLLLSFISVFYPIITGAFNEMTDVLVIFFALSNHFIISFISVCIAMLFSKNVISKSINSWLGISLTLVLLLSISSIEEGSIFYFLKYTLPPITILIDMMNKGLHSSILLSYLLSIFYSIILLLIFLFIAKRKDML
ncbi:hypothetical protein D7Z54_33325 [Salibacterium salarium]|uniref:Uncharacterized protein n=1 Tax=Salibacterium salarium TaxID=284579 RepID=A0A3R9QF62_9BACI|nr:hypothetical protein [Salibacterium salarium]RSL29044.1 hypothetical protein D7Z54_33325 [Salibacterium salarium]